MEKVRIRRPYLRALPAKTLFAIATTLALSVFFPVGVAAASNRPEALIQFPGDGVQGEAAGRMDLPQTLAASPITGDVYVADLSNARVDEFGAWGQFMRAFGWKVNANHPEEKLQVCTTASGCLKGSGGSGNGQFSHTGGSGDMRGGIAIDPAGDVYVGDMGNYRVQKFSATGEFLLTFGSEGTGNGQFSSEVSGNYIALSPDGATVYVGDHNRIEAFGANGTFKAQYTFKALHEAMASFPETATTRALATDPTNGDLYVALREGPASIFKLDPGTGNFVGTLTAPTLKRPTGLATDSDGDLYVVNDGSGVPEDGREEILKFDAAGNKLIPSHEEEEEGKAEEKAKGEGKPFEPFEPFGGPNDRTELFGITTDAACEAEENDLYVAHLFDLANLSYISAYGPPPQNTVKCPPPPPETPEIGAQYAIAVGTDSAVLKAEINPHYALDATYYVQYGTGKCTEGGCESQQPLAPGTGLPTKVSSTFLKTAGVFLSELSPGITYHYRFVVQSSGGGPVFGAEKTLNTFPVPPAPFSSCPNQAFRTGASAQLPDCRAYELVSPANRSPAGDIFGNGHSREEELSELNQSASDGEKLAYASEYAFGDAVAAPGTGEYIATRNQGEGWSSHAISPPRGQKYTNGFANLKLDIEEKAFTPDLCSSWLMHVTDTLLSPNAVPGFANLYQRQNCGAGADTYDSLSVAEAPIATGPTWTELQGFSTDGARSVFRANARLTADAPELGAAAYENVATQLYESSEGALRLACVLPDGSPYVGSCSAGTPGAGAPDGHRSSVSHAVSADASRIYWSAAPSEHAALPGPLYLRENAGEEQSAMVGSKCTEEEKACTYAVSTPGVGAKFGTAAADGSKAFYTEPEEPEGSSEKLREFDAETRKSKTIATEVLGVAGASEDGSRVYFASRKRLGGEGVAGQANLYLGEEGATKLVAILSGEDLNLDFEYRAIAPVETRPRPIAHGARVSADGRQLLFASTAALTPYDNHDAADGRPDDEVYLYEAGSGGPVCVSCNPSGARPTGRQVKGSNSAVRGIAAMIPAANSELYTPRALSADGDRVFFDSYEALVARDTNGKEDVYEWQRSADAKGCEEAGTELYVESSGGCLSLLSSGESPADSEFVDASQSGRDAFIRTAASLVAEDPGLIDIYDARQLGGFAPKPGIPPACEGEVCQSPPAAPNDPTPASSSFQGAGNVVEGQNKHKAHKKKHHKKAHKKQNRKRRTVR